MDMLWTVDDNLKKTSTTSVGTAAAKGGRE